LPNRTIYIPVRKNIHILRPVKDKLGLKVTGIYCLPCAGGKVYMGQTGRTILTRCKEKMTHIFLGQAENSAVAEHNLETRSVLTSAVPPY
jgi:hypothetical protein